MKYINPSYLADLVAETERAELPLTSSSSPSSGRDGDAWAACGSNAGCAGYQLKWTAQVCFVAGTVGLS